jgi:probable addiction module antidote protein
MLTQKEEYIEYLNFSLQESFKGNEVSFLMALRDVVRAQGGFALLAKRTGLGRESLYKALSSAGNPNWSTMLLILKHLNLKLTINLD